MDANAEIRERIQLFSLLRAAQRALSRCMHPAALDPVREHGRQLLIQLQALADAGADDAERHAEALAGIDRLLAHHMGQTLEIVANLDFAQLRAAGPRLCSEHPDDVRALIDLMLKHDLRHNKALRLLEFLITMLSTEESNGRRSVVQEPSQLTPGLRELAAQRSSESGPAPAAAEATLGSAVRGLIGGDDTAEMRDEMRSYKRELGTDILHPRVLAGAVAYNVAMWNQVAARSDGTLALDQLADDLLEDLSKAAEGAGGARSGSAQVDVLGSQGFARLMEAFRARLTGAEIADDGAARVVASFELGDLVAREIQAVESGAPDPVNRLICACVVLARAIRHRAEVHDSLESLSIEPERLATDALPDLMHEITAAARKLFADRRFEDAFELSEVRTRNLAALAMRSPRPESRSEGEAPTDGTLLSRWRLPFGVDPSPGLLAVILVILAGIGFAATLVFPPERDIEIVSCGGLANSPPTIVSLRIEERRGEDNEVAFWEARIWGRDPDGDAIEYRYRWLVNDRVTGVQGSGFPARELTRGDRLRVSVVASDGEAESAAAESRTLEIANRPPVIVSTPEGLDPSSRFFYRVEVVDGDGDRNLRYELLKGPRGMEMDGVFGELTWTPEPDQAGTHRVEVAVDDRHGGRATQAFDIPITVMELMPKSPPASIR